MQSKQTDKPPLPGTARGLGSQPRCRPSRDWHVPSRRISASPCSHARRAVATPIARPVTTAACALCGAQLGRGEVSSSNSSSRTSRTSSSDKTRQDNSRISGDTLVIPRRYPKMKKRTPRHQSPSSFQFQKGKTNTIQLWAKPSLTHFGFHSLAH